MSWAETEKIKEYIRENVPFSTIKHVQRGTVSAASSITLSGFTDVNKMIVLIDGDGGGMNTSNRGVHTITWYVSELTVNALTIGKTGNGNYGSPVCSYQVIEFN